MATVRKFLFDRSFDDVAPARVVEAAPAEPAPEPEPPPPTFSEADLALAREEGFAAGRAAALEEAAQGIGQATLDTLKDIDDQLHGLIEAQVAIEMQATEQAVQVALGVVHKIFPECERRLAVAEVERTVREAMALIEGEAQVVVTVSEATKGALEARLAGLAAQAAFPGRIELRSAPELAPSDCRIEWRTGGAVRDAAAIWQAIGEVAERNLPTIFANGAQGNGAAGDDAPGLDSQPIAADDAEKP